MKVEVAFIIGILASVSSGFLVGNSDGNFATNSSQESTTSKTDGVVDVNQPNPANDATNRQFLFDTISADRMKDVAREYSRKPHLAGSTRNNEIADMIENTWKSYGFETKRDLFNVLLSYPGGPTQRNQAFIWNSNNMIEFESQKEEKELVHNADADEIVPPFNAYAKAGDVKRDKAYYVNYCRAEDFDYITVDKGINVSDAIVICRYGKIFRGNKVRLAQDHGAAAVILYNDPHGSVDGVQATYNETFPNSWFLPPSGVERGGTSLSKGDPLTPGYPAKDYAIRKSVEQAREEKLIPGIPTQPVSYEDASKFFNALGGAEVTNEDWKGALDGVTYRFGGILRSGKQFQVKNYNTDERKDIVNVLGIIRGEVEPDRYVIYGNHRDAWMNGAVDPTSGTAIMMETSRAFSELMKTGWRPRRTIIFGSWDAEEYGIIGSIEWLDEVRVLIAERAVVYLNCDSGVVYGQYLRAFASPLLWNLMYDTAEMVKLPDGRSLYQQWWEVKGNTSDPNSKPRIYDLGSGTDHTGFYHRHGVTSMDGSYNYDESKMKLDTYYPLYHTSYDTFQAVERFVDPDFAHHKVLATYFTELTRNLSDSVIIPFVVNDYAIRLRQVYQHLDDVVRERLAHKSSSLTVSLDYLSASIDKFAVEAVRFDQEVSSLFNRKPSWIEVRIINDQLAKLERAFLYPLGILGRKYIKHVVFAPTATDQYDSTAFPGISDSLYKINFNDEPAWDKVKEELTKAVYIIESATKAITKDIII